MGQSQFQLPVDLASCKTATHDVKNLLKNKRNLVEYLYLIFVDWNIIFFTMTLESIMANNYYGHALGAKGVYFLCNTRTHKK